MKSTILISAYAVNPYKGSEDGTGWNISRELSKNHNCIVVTRKNNAPEIQRYFNQASNEDLSGLTFLYYDLPQWAMRLKKKLGERGYVLYFYFWQLFLPLFVYSNKVKFDLSYALNFHSDSTPQFLWVLGKPVIWGPVGHHPLVPSKYLKEYSLGAKLKDRVYNVVKWLMRNLDPFFYLAKWNSKFIIGINSSIQKAMRIPDSKFRVIPAVGNVDLGKTTKVKVDDFIVLSAGRLTAMKGFDITIRSFKAFIDQVPSEFKQRVKLRLVGSGECEMQLKNLTEKLDIHKHVEFINWVPKSKMKEYYNQASIFLFPSHEGAGMVVPEAMSYGLPVLCFDNFGPGELVGSEGIKIAYSSYENSINDFGKKMFQLFSNEAYRCEVALKMRQRFVDKFTWSKKGEEIHNLIEEVLTPKRKNIAVFHPSAELYGADRIMVNALRALPENAEKQVYLYRNGPLEELIMDSVANAHIHIVPKMPIIYRSMFTVSGLIKFMIQWAKFLVYFKKENKRYQFSSAYVNTLSSCFVLPILFLLRVKRYIHVHEIIDRPKVVGYVTAWMAWMFANKIVVVSEAVKRGLLRYVSADSQKIITIHNGIAPIELESRSENKRITFYLFGRIKPEKGQWFLIQTLGLLPKPLLQKARFVLMGGVAPGQEIMLQELEQIIEKHNLTDVVEIEGFSPCISSAMSNADVCLVPSIMKDPFPTTVLEAMSASKPVVSTNHGGAVEAILDNETGFLISPNNTKQFARVLTDLIQNNTLVRKMGVNGRNRFQKLFTLDTFESNWSDFVVRNNWV